jgi:hypothetical protein
VGGVSTPTSCAASPTRRTSHTSDREGHRRPAH